MTEVTPGPAARERKFVVLTFDGGGVRGLLAARILANLERTLNAADGADVPIGKRVDLVAGTSTGAIIALAVGMGARASEIEKWYEERIPQIFGGSKLGKLWRAIRRPRYRSDLLAAHLREFFKDARLADSICDLCVVSVALQTGRPRLYKTAYLERNRGRDIELMWEVALASSAAPTYFEPATPTVGGGPLIDGGLCANNPSVVALTEAAQFERSASIRGRAKPRRESWLDDTILISIGTGDRGQMPYDASKLARAGMLRWARPAIEIFGEAQSFAADRQAAFLLNQNYLRIQPPLGSAIALDDVSKLEFLKTPADLEKAASEFLRRNLGSLSPEHSSAPG